MSVPPHIARLASRSDTSEGEEFVVVGQDDLRRALAEHGALLEALERAVSALEASFDRSESTPVRRMARAAIARAVESH